MNQSTSFLHLGRKALAAAGLALSLVFASTANASSIYSYSVDTSAWAGESGVLAFDFINGDNVTNNTVTVTGFSTDGSLADLSAVVIQDIDFYNTVGRDIVFGSFLSFKISLTENFAGDTPDSFAFYLLDAVNFWPLVPTNDPLGTDAHFAIDITGAPGGNAGAYAGSLKVPDTGSSLALVLLGFAGLVAFARKSRRTA